MAREGPLGERMDRPAPGLQAGGEHRHEAILDLSSHRSGVRPTSRAVARSLARSISAQVTWIPPISTPDSVISLPSLQSFRLVIYLLAFF